MSRMRQDLVKTTGAEISRSGEPAEPPVYESTHHSYFVYAERYKVTSF